MRSRLTLCAMILCGCSAGVDPQTDVSDAGAVVESGTDVVAFDTGNVVDATDAIDSNAADVVATGDSAPADAPPIVCSAPDGTACFTPTGDGGNAWMCVDTQSNNMNCGACGNECATITFGDFANGANHCIAGACVCDHVGLTLCRPASDPNAASPCVDLHSSPYSCGQCGHTCFAPGGGIGTCSAGVCQH